MRSKVPAQIALFCWAVLLQAAQSPASKQQLPCSLRVAYVQPLRPQPARNGAIFADDFNAAPDRSRYFELDDRSGSFAWDAHGGMGGSGAMKAHFGKGQVEAGGLKVLFGRNPFHRGVRRDETFTEIWWRVYVKHQRGWDGDPAKLARLTCLASEDWSQAFIAHVWSGNNHSLCIDPATGIRDSRKVTTKYNDFEHLYWFGAKHGTTPIFSPGESGRWVCVEAHVRLNTQGHSDGAFQLWIDGRLEADSQGLDWQGNWADYAADAFFLENYWNSGAVKEESRWFSDLVIATKPIGPIVAASGAALKLVEHASGSWQVEASADSEGRETAWRSRLMAAGTDGAAITSADGAFIGGLPLSPGKTYWLRVRQHAADGTWTAWSPFHAPFRTPD